MTEQTQRLRRALEGCAELGISPTPQPWTEIESRLEARTTAPTRRSRRFLPKTRTGLALAAALFVLFGTGAYAASSLVYEEFRIQLPGAEGPVYGEQLGLQQTADGVKVSLEWAYADSRNVVVAYDIDDLKDNRRVAGRPAELASADMVALDRVRLTDESGTTFISTDGQGAASGTLDPLEEVPASGVYAPKKAIEPGKHRFRLSIPVVAQALPSYDRWEPVGKPFVFDFEIPVRPAPIVEVNQTVEADGVALTLERVADSPARPEARVCYGAADMDYDWYISGEEGPSNGVAGLGFEPGLGESRACSTMLLPDSLEGRSTVTVDRVDGTPRCPPDDDSGCRVDPSRVKTFEGPWTFEFTAPER